MISPKFPLEDGNKTIEELDADFLTFEKLEQYDENGIIGFAMSSGQHSVVVYDFEADVDASYSPADARPLGAELNQLFVGHRLGASAVQKARRFIVEHRAAQEEIRGERNGYSIHAARIPPAGQFSDRPSGIKGSGNGSTQNLRPFTTAGLFVGFAGSSTTVRVSP